jgi:tetratricopeptide (TPR) repeat protein
MPDKNNGKKNVKKKTRAYRKLVIRYKVGSTVFIIVMLLLGIPYIFTHKRSYRNQGVEYYDQGDYESAIESFDKALDAKQWFSENVDVDVLMYEASAYLHIQDYAAAKDVYDTMLENYSDRYMDSDEINYLSELCGTLVNYADGRYSDSIAVLTEACDKGYTELALYTAVCYESIQDYDSMKKYLDLYQQTNPVDAYVYAKYADLYIATGDYSSAMTNIESAIALNQDRYMQELYYRQIICYEKLGNYTQAYELSQTYVSNYPDDERGVKLNDYLLTRAYPDTEVVNDIFGVNSGSEDKTSVEIMSVE